LSARLRDQLALQVMVSIALAHDRQSELVANLKNLAAYQQVPAPVLARMLEALQKDGLVIQSADIPPSYFPGAALQRISLVDILRSARNAEDEGQSDSLRSDAEVSRLLQSLEQQLETQLGEETLAGFIQSIEEDQGHEDSLV
jgi:DNA-binding IscR family transcriptional regulator